MPSYNDARTSNRTRAVLLYECCYYVYVMSPVMGESVMRHDERTITNRQQKDRDTRGTGASGAAVREMRQTSRRRYGQRHNVNDKGCQDYDRER